MFDTDCPINNAISSVQAQKHLGQGRSVWHIITIFLRHADIDVFLSVFLMHSSLSPQLRGSAIKYAAMELHIGALYICGDRSGVSVGSAFHIY